MKELENIAAVQSVLFDALCYFDDFCAENGIEYFLSNGTLLGAAKYKKFIPWDDDVDVLLPRKDYDKLMKLPQINNGKYRLLSVEQVPEWRMPYAKLSCEETVLREGEYDFGVQFGLSVDIFPIDRWSSHLWIAKAQAFKSEVLKRLLVCSIGGDFQSDKRGVKRAILKTIWAFGKKMGHENVRKKILRSTERSKKRPEKYAGCISWTCHLDKEIFPAECFKEVTRLEFCGRSFPCVKNYAHYLDRLYGNWRAELPPEQQHSNHSIKVWWKDAK